MTAAATVTALLGRAAADFPAAAVGFPQDGTRLPLGRLAGSAAAVAGGLARLGTGPGRRVGVLFGTEPDFLPALFGILRTGAAVCPLPLPTTARDLPAYLDRLTGIVTAAGLTHVVVSDRLGELEAPLAAALGVPLLHPAELAGAGGPAPADRADPEDPAILQFTSGSTAAPRAWCCRTGRWSPAWTRSTAAPGWTGSATRAPSGCRSTTTWACSGRSPRCRSGCRSTCGRRPTSSGTRTAGWPRWRRPGTPSARCPTSRTTSWSTRSRRRRWPGST